MEPAPDAKGARPKPGGADAAFVLLSPVLAWAALGINLINQNYYVDPWVYTGYGQIFERLVEVHGWSYYAIRFPVVFLNTLCCSGDSPVLGYALLRYFVLLLAGVPLYLLAMRHFGRPAAVCGYLFLFCNPLLPRILLWDLSTFVSIPAALAGIVIWMLAEERRALGRLVAGALFAVSVNAHIFTATAIGCFLVVEIAFTRGRDLRALARDLAFAALGAGATVALGILYLRSRAGAFDPALFFSLNLEAMASGTRYAVSHARPFLSWATISTYVYVPLILLVGMVALRRQRSGSLVEERIFWFLVLYCVFYAVYRFALGRFVLEEFYYFGHLTIAVYPVVPALVGRLGRRHGSAPAAAGAFAAGLLLPMLALRLAFDHVAALLQLAAGSLSGMVMFGVLSVSPLVLLGTKRVSPRVAWAASFLVALSCQLATLRDPTHRSVFDGRAVATERGLYLTSVQFARFVAEYDGPTHRVLAWYPLRYSLVSATSSALGDTLQDPYGTTWMPTLGRRELDRLGAPNLSYVMLLAQSQPEVAGAKASLQAAGFESRVVERRLLGDAGYSAIAVLLKIRRPGP